MVRPMKEYRAEINKNSLKLFERGVYVGSLPVKFLVELAKAEESKAQILESLQKPEAEKPVTGDPEMQNRRIPPKGEFAPERLPSTLE